MVLRAAPRRAYPREVHRRWAPWLLLPLGVVLGALIAGLPDVTSEMRADVRASLATTSTAAQEGAPITSVGGAPTEPTEPTEPEGPTGTAARPSASGRPPEDVVVLVLNGAAIGGAAGALTEQVDALGYQTRPPSNTTLYDGTVVQFVEGYEVEAAQLATAIHPSVPTEPLVPGASGPEGVHLVVVIGSDYPAIRDAR